MVLEVTVEGGGIRACLQLETVVKKVDINLSESESEVSDHRCKFSNLSNSLNELS